MKHFNKRREYKTTDIAVNEIRIAGEYILNQKGFEIPNNSIFTITLTDTGCKHERDLNHALTNRLFNNIKNHYKGTKEHINYLFVIEYPEVISKGNFLPTNCEVHAHIIVNTSLSKSIIEHHIVNTFSSSVNVKVEDITNRDDKDRTIGYLVKQGYKNYTLSDSSYNYKININEIAIVD